MTQTIPTIKAHTPKKVALTATQPSKLTAQIISKMPKSKPAI